jgi:hypothetical protein
VIKWDEFMPNAALGALTLVCGPLLIFAIPLYFIGTLTARWFDHIKARTEDAA